MFNHDYARCFEGMLAEARQAGSGLTAFWPVVGRHYEGADVRLLVVGRSPNGWGGHGLDSSRARSVSNVSSGGSVIDKSKYNPRRSAFWAVARETLEHLGVRQHVDEVGPNAWMQSLAWSNLFKVAPVAGWNPNTQTRRVVRAPCVELLRMEVAQLKPNVVLVLAGADWFDAFGKGLGLSLEGPVGKYVDDVSDGFGARWVVARHPMKKPRAPFMADVKVALAVPKEPGAGALRFHRQ